MSEVAADNKDSKTITAAVGSAATELAEGEKETPVVEENKEEKKEETKEAPKEGELSQEQLLQAKQLFLALNDPERANIIVDFLAQKHGYTKLETKAEVKEAKDDIVETLKKELGSDLEFLADKLAPAITKILNKRRLEDTKDIREELEQQQTEKLKTQAANTMEKLAKDFGFADDKIPSDIVGEMNALMDKITPSPDMSVADYVETIFNSVVGKRGIKKTDKTTQDRVKHNRSDAASRLASSGAKEPLLGEDRSKKMTLKESVEAAALEIAEKGGKED